MASNDPILEGVGLTHLGSSKALLGKHEGPFITEFRDFALRGNMVDMAVGIIIGAAFGRGEFPGQRHSHASDWAVDGPI
jgi:hypothetical protein